MNEDRKDYLLELAWGLIANAGWDASTGNVDLPKTEGWHVAALRWRNEYHALGPLGETEEPTDPKEWFDRYISWADQAAIGWPQNGQWCPRHWAPCPLDGYNGVGASVSIMMAFKEEQGDLTSDQLHVEVARIVEKYGAICCALGDESMRELWREWPAEHRLPGQIDARPEDQ